VSHAITPDTLPSVLDEVQTAFFDIPFENSAFQNLNFVLGTQLTPERAYRALGLRLSAKIRALQEAQYARQLEDIAIAELREKIESPDTSKWDKMRSDVEINKLLDQRRYTDKLIHDALMECNTLYQAFQAFPRYTREQFEAGEVRHFELRLSRQLQGVVGAKESLAAMGHDFARLMKEASADLSSLAHSESL
jgi:hypothetical protein